MPRKASMKNLTEIISFLEDVLGKEAAQAFDDNMEEFTYFVRSEALTNQKITENKISKKKSKHYYQPSK